VPGDKEPLGMKVASIFLDIPGIIEEFVSGIGMVSRVTPWSLIIDVCPSTLK
jgi:hypothetical protein